MKVQVTYGVTYNTRYDILDLEEDLGYTIDEWNALNDDEKREALNEYSDNIPESPSWAVEKFTETE